jgi:hypothetical protein
MAQIRRCELGVNAPLMGAAELVLAEVIANPAALADLDEGTWQPAMASEENSTRPASV